MKNISRNNRSKSIRENIRSKIIGRNNRLTSVYYKQLSKFYHLQILANEVPFRKKTIMYYHLEVSIMIYHFKIATIKYFLESIYKEISSKNYRS